MEEREWMVRQRRGQSTGPVGGHFDVSEVLERGGTLQWVRGQSEQSLVQACWRQEGVGGERWLRQWGATHGSFCILLHTMPSSEWRGLLGGYFLPKKTYSRIHYLDKPKKGRSHQSSFFFF